jgi:hypothetical protein
MHDMKTARVLGLDETNRELLSFGSYAAISVDSQHRYQRNDNQYDHQIPHCSLTPCPTSGEDAEGGNLVGQVPTIFITRPAK